MPVRGGGAAVVQQQRRRRRRDTPHAPHAGAHLGSLRRRHRCRMRRRWRLSTYPASNQGPRWRSAVRWRLTRAYVPQRPCRTSLSPHRGAACLLHVDSAAWHVAARHGTALHLCDVTAFLAPIAGPASPAPALFLSQTHPMGQPHSSLLHFVMPPKEPRSHGGGEQPSYAAAGARGVCGRAGRRAQCTGGCTGASSLWRVLPHIGASLAALAVCSRHRRRARAAWTHTCQPPHGTC